MNTLRAMGVALGSAVTALNASAQIDETLKALFQNYDLVCSSLRPDNTLNCQFRPKAALTSGANMGAVATPPVPAAMASNSPVPAAQPDPMAAAAAAMAAAPLPHPSNATAPPPPPDKKSFVQALREIENVDLSVPESPAFAVLGISPSEIQRPGSLRELGASLLRSVDENGKAKTGAAFDFAPLPLVAPQSIRGGLKYKENPLLQVGARTTFSLATTAAESDTSSQTAWGLRVGLYDAGDPGLHYEKLLQCAKEVPLPAVAAGRTVDSPSDTSYKEGLKSCFKTNLGELWAEPALYAGFGQSRYSQSGKFGGTPSVNAWWLTYSKGWVPQAQSNAPRVLFQLHASRRTDERVPDPDNAAALIRQDSTLMVGRLRAGQDRWRAFIDLGRKRVKLGPAPTDNVRHAGIGAEFRLSDDLWLQVGGVSERGYADGISRNRVTTGLRFGSEPILQVPDSR